MVLTPEEVAKQARFAEIYARSQCPAILSVERSVCGCDYGGNSWTGRDEAGRIAALLCLEPGIHLLDLGAGAGWPGLYIARESGCEATLVDLPLSGLKIAQERAVKDRISDRCRVALADASNLPFRAGSFDAVCHIDVLCCLKDKRGVLEACRRVIRDKGRMVFTVIWITPGLSPADRARALAGAPEFAAVEPDYPTLLEETGWTLLETRDVTKAYAATVRAFMRADGENKEGLEALLGAAEFADRQAGWRAELDAVEEGLLRRDLFVAASTSLEPKGCKAPIDL